MRTVRFGRLGAAAVLTVIGGVAMTAAACSSGTSSSDKTATAEAGAPAPTTAPPTAAAAQPTTPSGTTGSATVNIATSGDSRFVDAAGLTLYVFKNDTANSGKSSCNGACATNWPPLVAPASGTPVPGNGVDGLGVITRDDGTMQVTYDGLPLYHFATDKAPGDENGKDIPNWSLAIP
jgi:predicted lipoprotein with Yx(FWY)xxD motif